MQSTVHLRYEFLMQAQVKQLTETLKDGIQSKFASHRTVLSFSEYLDEVVANPRAHIRAAAQYFHDVIEHFSSYSVNLPVGEVKRYKAFDAPYDQGEGQVMGQERVQAHLVRQIHNFVRAGRVDRLLLLHGPNGSAKTSLIQALTRSAEVYSETAEGALYRFNWVFPLKKAVKGSLGFSSASDIDTSSYAHLDGSDIEARIPCEHKDHPLLLLSTEYRNAFLKQFSCPIPDVLRKGDLSPKNRKIFDALLTSYHGKVDEVLRHIQVERFYLSRRYRTGIASVEPQMSVDGYTRQVTADQSLASLPTALQHISLFETGGPLSDGNRGLVEYNDLLKRPMESWKYLLVATEQSQASIDTLSLFLDMLMVASSNELHLTSFREYPDWQSFKGRFDLIKVPYLLRFSDEVKIYQNQIPRALVGLHIAPHSLEIAARWAVLTRLEPPMSEDFKDLTPLEKLELYDTAKVPERLTQKEARQIRQQISHLSDEYEDSVDYEGRYGASPREIRTLLLNAAQDKRFDHLSPVAVIDAIRTLVREKSSYEFLRREAMRGYRDAERLIDVVSQVYSRQLDEEIRAAMGLVTADSHAQAFERYMKHVSAWMKKEKIPNPITGKLADADVEVMGKIEKVLLAQGESPEEFRQSLISHIGAFRLEQPDQPVDYTMLFGGHLRRLQEDYFAQQRQVVKQLQTHYLQMLEGDDKQLNDKDKAKVKVLHDNMLAIGYNDASARQAIAFSAR